MSEMGTYKTSEIFYSLQGEGAYAGTPMIFVRFAGCNMHCAHCDQANRNTVTREWTLVSLLAFLDRWNVARRICLTGGEPLLQADDALLTMLTNRFDCVHIETNGTVHAPRFMRHGPASCMYVTCSPKDPKRLALDWVNEVKLVLPGPVTPPEAMARWKHCKNWFVQPLWVDDEQERHANVVQCVDFVKAVPGWRLSAQVHKYLGIA